MKFISKYFSIKQEMMKNYSYLLIAVFALTTACKKEDKIFTQTPDERINETLAKYQSVLVGSAAGWKATIQPGYGGLYNYFFQFNNQNRVSMYCDFDTATARSKGESSYRLKVMQQPSLIFDTYSYLHILSDPSPDKNGGVAGQGLVSDFEFAFEDVTEDSIILVGRMNKTRVKLERASQADLDAWQNGKWSNVLSFLNIEDIEKYFKRLTVGGSAYEVVVDPLTRTISFSWLSGGNLNTFTTTYYYTGEGLMLKDPLINGSQTIGSLSNFNWNSNSQTLQLTAGSVNGSIAGADKPLKVDAAAPLQWWQEAVNADTYWFSPYGFHSNGTDDIFNLSSLGRFYYLIYWPEYDPGNDLLAPVFVNAAGTGLTFTYGAAPEKPTVTADGRAIFSILGVYGTYPTSGPAFQTLNQLMSPEGYYFVPTSYGYDMVSAADAKTWISWQLAN